MLKKYSVTKRPVGVRESKMEREKRQRDLVCTCVHMHRLNLSLEERKHDTLKYQPEFACYNALVTLEQTKLMSYACLSLPCRESCGRRLAFQKNTQQRFRVIIMMNCVGMELPMLPIWIVGCGTRMCQL